MICVHWSICFFIQKFHVIELSYDPISSFCSPQLIIQLKILHLFH
jgi:hypothetical protein